MKKFFTLFALLATSLCVTAQQIDLQPSAGFGIAGALQNPYLDNTGTIPTYNIGAAAVLNVHRLQFSAGLSFFSTGFGNTGEFTLTDVNGNPIGTTYSTYHFRLLHIGIPLSVGFSSDITHRFSVVYSLGLLPAYNIAARAGLTTNGYTPRSVGKEEFDAKYSRFSLFGLAQARFQYTFPKGLKVFAGPAFRPMLTSDLKSGSALQERELAITLDVGAGLPLHAAKSKKKSGAKSDRLK